MRLDTFLVDKGQCSSKNKASELIKSGFVFVDDAIVLKPSFEISAQKVEVRKEKLYVSRAAEKLVWFLSRFEIVIKDKECLDIGSSTGGFVQVLLEEGAKNVTCVDVGKEQMDAALRTDKRVELHEETDFRGFQSDKKYEIVTCDVSFISVFLLLERIDFYAKELIILLFKPQFEVGREVKRNKKGVLLDQAAVLQKKSELKRCTDDLGWRLLCELECEIRGKEGNIESFYCFEK